MKVKILSILATAAISLSPFANGIDFDLKDPKGVNNIVFLLDAPLESINGTATGITGSVSYDPSAPEKASGKVVVAVDSLTVANPKMIEHMMGDKWLNEAEYPEITFALSELTDVSKSGDTVSGTAMGSMSIKGETKEIEVPVSLTYLEGKMQDRQRTPGDILVIRSKFSLSRSDFGINEGAMEDKVSDEIELRLSIAGFAPTDS